MGSVVEEIREGLRQLSGYDEASVELWLRTPHLMLDGDVPQELIDAGEGELVLELVRHMFSGGHAGAAALALNRPYRWVKTVPRGRRLGLKALQRGRQ